MFKPLWSWNSISHFSLCPNCSFLRQSTTSTNSWIRLFAFGTTQRARTLHGIMSRCSLELWRMGCLFSNLWRWHAEKISQLYRFQRQTSFWWKVCFSGENSYSNLRPGSVSQMGLWRLDTGKNWFFHMPYLLIRPKLLQHN